MSTDWQEKERDFLNALKADTGRDLGEWMRVIAAENLPHRNDIIDWLRQQGFMFARASWLERIHHNGGRPIYCDPADLVTEADGGEMVARRVAGGGTIYSPAEFAPSKPAEHPARVAASPPPAPSRETPRQQIAEVTMEAAPSRAPLERRTQEEVGEVPLATPDNAPTEQPYPVVPPAAPSAEARPHAAAAPRTDVDRPAESLDDVLARAKAYRPLAQHLVRLIESAVPGLTLTPGAQHIALGHGATTFGLIAISAKDIRLVLRLAPALARPPFGPVKLPAALGKAADGMTHMAVLTDARQLDSGLVNLITAAAPRR